MTDTTARTHAMKLNDLIIDPDGRKAKLITMPIPGRTPALGVALYDDGRGRQVDLAQCRPVEEREPCPPNTSS